MKFCDDHEWVGCTPSEECPECKEIHRMMGLVPESDTANNVGTYDPVVEMIELLKRRRADVIRERNAAHSQSNLNKAHRWSDELDLINEELVKLFIHLQEKTK